MGSPISEAGRNKSEIQHEVSISKPFYLGKYEITQAQWQQVMKTNPSKFKGFADFPVENISFGDIQDFCRNLKSITFAPFEIPTEAQWEYACRAGTTTPYHFGNQLNGIQANCDGNRPYGTDKNGPFLQKTSRVGEYPANAWGLHDMHGNVFEWCADWYGDYLFDSVMDPRGVTNGSLRVLRGGSWHFYARFCRTAERGKCDPALRYDFCGGRVFLPIDF